jgi:hypothetical protein
MLEVALDDGVFLRTKRLELRAVARGTWRQLSWLRSAPTCRDSRGPCNWRSGCCRKTELNHGAEARGLANGCFCAA